MPQQDGGGPAVVSGSWYRFRGGERIHNRHVESVCFVWTVSGAGTFVCNGRTFVANTDSLLRLPWRHDVRYDAHRTAPFHVGTVHVVPWVDADDDFVARVAFRDGDPLLGAPTRHGADSGSEVTEIPAHSAAGRRIVDLATYAIDRFLADRAEEGALRALGALIMDESQAWDRASADRQYPAALSRMMRFVHENLQSPLSLRAVADAGAVSTATAERLFARHTGSSVVAWIREHRMREAAALLQSSGLRIREVARQVGFSDAFYFSRVFTASFGVPPSRYADRLVRP